MLQVLFCDDDPQILAQYVNRVEQLAQKHQIEIRTACFPSAESLLFALEDSPGDADILYLDVQMERMSGIDAARRLREAGCRAQIIFLTQMREAVFESFDAAPLQYLVKGGFTGEKFEQTFLKAARLARRNTGELFHCERGADRRAIPLREILYFEVRKRIITVHYDSGAFAFYSSMDELETRLLDKGFVRTHRAFLVSLARIRRMGQETLLLTSGEEIPLGRTHAKKVREVLSRFLSDGGLTF